MKNLFVRYILSGLVLGWLIGLTGCKKELELHSNTEILLFEYVDNNGESLLAPVHGDTIYVYWPPLQAAPDKLVPKITVHESASISPASETEIPMSSSQVYTVRAENGATQKYFVKLVTNQPYPFISNVQNINTANGLRYWVNNRTLIFVGDNFLFDGMTTKVWARTDAGVSVPVAIADNTGARLTLSAPANGKYRIIIEVGERKLEYFYEIEVIDPFVSPSVTGPAAAITVKRGDTFSLASALSANITAVKMGDYAVQTPLQIVSAEGSTLTLKVPADFPAGTHIRLTFEYSGGQYFNAGSGTASLSKGVTVTE